MRVLANVGADRAIDAIAPTLRSSTAAGVVTNKLSLFAFEAIGSELERLNGTRLILPSDPYVLDLLGTGADRAARNRFVAPHLAARLERWLETSANTRSVAGGIPLGAIIGFDADVTAQSALHGSISLTTDGLGVTPAGPLGFIQSAETSVEAAMIGAWFEAQWASLELSAGVPSELVGLLGQVSNPRPPTTAYATVLHNVLGSSGAIDEAHVLRTATGIQNTAVWKKLYRFQRDGVLGILSTLDRFGGCILADSVGLGKTFEALAVVKYHELRNDRVLVLCPKRLRENWTLYRSNDTRNFLAGDRFNYDVLNHTDLSRDAGTTGDVDLSHVNWGNYDLVVIDESHNFRNKKTPRSGAETRYDRLMRRIIREGVKTRVLMLSATPVNNRLADLRNQIAFATEGRDDALRGEGIDSIDSTTRRAQQQFNKWQKLAEEDRTPVRLVEMFGFDYFTLLDRLTIARSRKHIEKYYGTSETGRFPDRLPPINIKKGTDLGGEFPPIEQVNREIRKLTLAAYRPLSYVLPERQPAYEAKYSTEVQGGKGVWRQQDREQSLVHLMRVNLLKRMESSIASLTLTLDRQLADVESLLERIDAGGEAIDTEDHPDLEVLDLDDPSMEALVVGRTVRVLLADVDRRRWRQDLVEDRNRLHALHAAAHRVGSRRDEKLQALRELIQQKAASPFNPGNRKMLVFSAFADTVRYLYEHLSDWAHESLGLHVAFVTGSGGNRTTNPALKRDLASILSAFAPRARERPGMLAGEGEIDLLIATDCISEGQNLQDCDCVVNYDIHWNPVRIIQRFGRVDRLGSPNERIQLVNFWPNIELDEYIKLEQRVSGRMTLLDVSATGEENLIETQSGDAMNDFEYRRAQLLKLKDRVIDLDDLSAGVSISDLTLSDFRVDLAQFVAANPGLLDRGLLGAWTVTVSADDDVPEGTIFCLRAVGPAAERAHESGYPLAPHYLVHVTKDGAVSLGFMQAKRLLERLRGLCSGLDSVDAAAASSVGLSSGGEAAAQILREQLLAATSSITGQEDERAVASLFASGGTATHGAGGRRDDFEVVAYFIVRAPAVG